MLETTRPLGTKGAVWMNIGQSSDQVHHYNLSKAQNTRKSWPKEKKKYLDPLGFSKCIQNRQYHVIQSETRNRKANSSFKEGIYHRQSTNMR